MRSVLALAILVLVFAAATPAQARGFWKRLFSRVRPAPYDEDVSVRSYTRRDGTEVVAHHRSHPDSTVENNWSTIGNSNPSTGALGTRSPTTRSRGLVGSSLFSVPAYEPIHANAPVYRTPSIPAYRPAPTYGGSSFLPTSSSSLLGTSRHSIGSGSVYRPFGGF